ncbi:MAG: hypothetical protein ABIW82_17005 [Dokdonella sp.]
MSDHSHNASASTSSDRDDSHAVVSRSRPTIRQDQWSGFTVENIGPANEFQSVSISIDDFNVLLTRTADGLVVDVFAAADVAFDAPIATAMATDDELAAQSRVPDACGSARRLSPS